MMEYRTVNPTAIPRNPFLVKASRNQAATTEWPPEGESSSTLLTSHAHLSSQIYWRAPSTIRIMNATGIHNLTYGLQNQDKPWSDLSKLMHSTEIPDLDLDTITITECNCGTEVFWSFQLWVKLLHYVRQGYFRIVCMGTNVSKHVCAELPKGRVQVFTVFYLCSIPLSLENHYYPTQITYFCWSHQS